MPTHCGRHCLVRKQQGIPCKKKDCLYRQRVFENYCKYSANVLAKGILKGNKKANRCEGVPSRKQNSRETIIHIRGRTLCRIGARERQCSMRITFRKKQGRYTLCGGGPSEKIELKKYVRTLKEAKIPLKQKLDLYHEVPVVCRWYFNSEIISDAKIVLLWKFHQKNFKAIARLYKRKTVAEVPPVRNHDVREAGLAEYTAEVCSRFLQKLYTQQALDVSAHKRDELAVSVSSRIAAELLARSKNSNSLINDEDCILTSSEERTSAADLENDTAEMALVDGSSSSSSDEKTIPEANAKKPSNEFKETAEKEDTKEDYFRRFGVSNNLASILTASSIRGSGNFEVTVDGSIHTIHLDPSWKNLPIKSSQSGYRQFCGNWTLFFNEILKGINPYCCFAFKKHYIKQSTSRKKKSPFFKAWAMCTNEPCKCKAFLVIEDEQHEQIRISFAGNVSHKQSSLKARRITGEARDEIRQEFINSKVKPSTLYRERLKNMPAEEYVAGNRSVCGVTAKAFQNISSEANKEMNNLDLVAAKIRECDERISRETVKLFKNMKEKLKVSGYVQSNDITKSTLSVVLMDEGSVRLYRSICDKDVLFFDATGTIIKDIVGLKRLLLYSLTTRDPLGKSPPIPIAEMISSTHTASAIRRLLIVLREKERFLFADNRQPIAVRTDFSMAMISACVAELNNGMSLEQYINACYGILEGTTLDANLSLVLVCSAHVMKMNSRYITACARKRQAEGSYRSSKHLAMRIIGLLANTESLKDVVNIVRLAYIAFSSEYDSDELKDALNALASMINEFNPAASVDNDCDLEGSDTCIESESSENCDSSGNKFFIKVNEHLDNIQIAEGDGKTKNKYHLPSYMAYFRSFMIPHLPLWTRIMLNTEVNRSLQQKLVDVKDLTGKRGLDIGNTNAHAENYFAFVKGSFSTKSVPIHDFIYKHFEHVQGLRRQFIDSLRVAKQRSEKRSDTNPIKLRRLEQTTPRYPNEEMSVTDDSAVEEEQEKWQKPPNPKKECRLSGEYSEPPSVPIYFNPTTSKANVKSRKSMRGTKAKEERMKFQVYKVKNWQSVAGKHSSTEKCLEELQRRFTRLSDIERRKLATPEVQKMKLYCLCMKPYNRHGPLMVQCNICQNWYHSSCIKMNDTFLSTLIPRYHCESCVEKTFRAIRNYIHHNVDTLNDNLSSGIRELYDELNSIDSEGMRIISTHEFIASNIKHRLPSLSVLRHEKGIRNEQNNCWYSSILQVVCGTGIMDLLLTYNESKEQPISKCLIACRNSLISKSRSHVPLRSVQNIGIELNKHFLSKRDFDPRGGEQKDASEFYSSLITCYFETILNDEIMADFQFTHVDVRSCHNCKAMAGSMHRNIFFSVGVIETTHHINLEELIWAQLLGEHSDDQDLKTSVCNPSCKSASVWQGSFIKNFPSILAIELKRGRWEKAETSVGKIIQTPINFPRKLDLTSYGLHKSDARYRYTLKAAVCHYAYTSESGHYACHLFQETSVVTYDDTKVKTRRIDQFLELETVKKSIHLLFYILDGSESVRDCPMPCAAEQRLAEKYWFGLVEPLSTQITTADLRTLCKGQYVNGTIISYFLFSIANQLTDMKIMVCSTDFYANLKADRLNTSEVNSALTRQDLFLQDVIVVPVNIGGSHWVVSAIYPEAKCVVIVDSIRDAGQRKSVFDKLLSMMKLYSDAHAFPFNIHDWILINPRTVPLQQDSESCGIFTCVNGYNCMLPGIFYIPRRENIQYFRYWIAVIAGRAETLPIFKRQQSQVKVNADIIEEKKNSIIIRDVVPGYSKTVCFYEALKKFINQRRQDALNVMGSCKDNRKEESEEESSNDSLYDEIIAVRKKTDVIRSLKDSLLKRLILNLDKGNERYVVLAHYGRSMLTALLRREVEEITKHLEEDDMETSKKALYELFRAEESDHQYFNTTLPSISCKRYGLTSAEFIDYIIFPDMLCLEHMRSMKASYEEAVSEMSTGRKSRLSVYWNYAL